MNRKIIPLILATTCSLFFLNCSAHAQGTAFTYQGKLSLGSNAANGYYDFSFTLYTNSSGGSAIAGPVTNTAVSVTNGVFTTIVNLGDPFNGTSNWLQIAVSPSGSDTFTALTPRQQVTPVPYAITAENVTTGGLSAGVYGNAVTLNNPANSFTGNGGGLTNLSAATLTGGEAMGGGFSNSISTSGAQYSFVGGGYSNNIQANSLESTIGGGYSNSILPNAGYSFIGGGANNQTASGWSTICGGNGNMIGLATLGSTIGGGYNNTNTASYATIPGGLQNDATGMYSFAAGQQAKALHQGAFVWADSQSAAFSSTGNNQFDVRAGGGVNFTTSGTGITVDGPVITPTVTNSGSITLKTGGNLNVTVLTNLNVTTGGTCDLTSTGSMTLQASSTATIKSDMDLSLQSSGGTVDVSPSGVAISGTMVSFSGSFSTVLFNGFTCSGIANIGTLECGEIIGSVGIGTSSPQQSLSVVGGINIDQAGTNTGSISTNALTFGSFSGEGIASKRTSGGTQYDLEFYTAGNLRMEILNDGNVGIGNNNPSSLLVVGTGGAYCNGTTWVSGSDRNSKQDFTAVDPQEVLAKIATIPVTEWRYKVDTNGIRHIGPMAQDFHAAFGLNGNDDTHIATVDESGVALAAIQGLDQKLHEKDAKIADLEKRMERLEQLLIAKTGETK